MTDVEVSGLEKSLKTLGIIFILLGIMGGIIVMSTANWHDYRFAKQVYQGIPTNQYAQAEYDTQRNLLFAEVGAGVLAIGAGAISGILFLAMAQGLQLLAGIKYEIQTMRYEQGKRSSVG